MGPRTRLRAGLRFAGCRFKGHQCGSGRCRGILVLKAAVGPGVQKSPLKIACTPKKELVRKGLQQTPAKIGDVAMHGSGCTLAQIPSNPQQPAAVFRKLPSEAPVDDAMVVEGVGAILDNMVQLSNRGKQTHSMTCFHSARAPSISVKDYLARMQRFLGCSGECYILSLLYIDRLVKRRSWIQVTALSCHRLVLCSLVLAAKFQDDKFYSNDFYARVGGLKLQELNALELSFMKLLDWKVHTLPQEYEYYRDLVCRAATSSVT